MLPSSVEIVAAALFGIAVLHTFLTKHFERLAKLQPRHAGVWHLLGEVEVVFGFWAFVLLVFIALSSGKEATVAYLEGLNFTEPMFVFVIMVVAASKPVIDFCKLAVRALANLAPAGKGVAYYFVCLSVVPLLGSLITEPAAMTLAALLLRDQYYSRGISYRLRYATLGVLFVNISIGGTLTPFAAPPVLMVAGKWGWDLAFMLTTLGWKAALAVVFNAAFVTAVYAGELSRLELDTPDGGESRVPWLMMAVHLAFLAGVVMFAHHAVVFMGLFLLFLGFVEAYKVHQDKLMLREGLLVAFFLAGLVTLGALQKWWLQDVLAGMNDTALYFGATALTAITDNAALTYLGSLVEGVDDGYKYALVAGAVTGGGLTIIANAPNPAGFAVLKGYFEDEAISPMMLLFSALGPTLVAVGAFLLL